MWVKSGTWSEVFSSAETADQSNLSSHTILKCVDMCVFAWCAWCAWCVFVLDPLYITYNRMYIYACVCLYGKVQRNIEKYKYLSCR